MFQLLEQVVSFILMSLGNPAINTGWTGGSGVLLFNALCFPCSQEGRHNQGSFVVGFT